MSYEEWTPIETVPDDDRELEIKLKARYDYEYDSWFIVDGDKPSSECLIIIPTHWKDIEPPKD